MAGGAAVLLAGCVGMTPRVSQAQLNAIASACEKQAGVTATQLSYSYEWGGGAGVTYRLLPTRYVTVRQANRVNACIAPQIARIEQSGATGVTAVAVVPAPAPRSACGPSVFRGGSGYCLK